MNRYVATSLLVMTTGAMLVFVAHGCALNPFAGYSYDEAQKELASSASSTSSTGGAGGTGGATTTSSTSSSTGNPNCTCAAPDDNPCTTDLLAGQNCPGADESSCHTPAPATPCTDLNGNPAFCDADGMCTPCKDCSDANCAHRCQGQSCAGPANCANGKCVDGFCCDTDCIGECNACNRVPGTCTPLPVGMQGICPPGQLCGNTNSCKVTQKKALGDFCSTGADCESGTCQGQICVSTNGQPCVENLECASRLCDPATHTCRSCSSGNVVCPGGAGCLPGGTCQALPGQPASNSMECKPPAKVNDQLTCTLSVGEACTSDSECIYHDCESMGTCATNCTIDAQCPLGITCNKPKGWCLLPKGSLCVTDDQCQGPNGTIGLCAGFPRRCQ